MEEIKIVPKYEWCSVDRQGNLYSTRRGRQYKLYKDRYGYLKVTTKLNTKNVSILAHRAVLMAFVGPPIGDKNQCNHIDGNKLNNCLDNLEWCNNSENQLHAIRTGLRKIQYGVDASSNRYSEDTIIKLCEMLQEGYRNSDIRKILNVDVKLPSDIRNGRSWTHISKNYKFDVGVRGRLSVETVHYICKLLQLGWGVTRIVNESNNPNIKPHTVKHIKRRTVYKDIVSLYTF